MTNDPSDPFLVVGITVLILVMLVINVYFLVHYQHPEDKNESYLAKLLILFGFQISAVSVLMLPVDVANNAGSPHCDVNSLLNSSNQYCGRINMFLLWECLFCMVCFVLVVLIPFSILYYESGVVELPQHGVEEKSKFLPALLQEIVVIVFFLVVIFSVYFTKNGITNIPFDVQVFDINNLEISEYKNQLMQTTIQTRSYVNTIPTAMSTDNISYEVTFVVYLIAYFGWIGWWFFSLFAGLGLTSVPFDLITAYIYRPRLLAPDVLAKNEIELQNRSKDLMEVMLLFKKERKIFEQTNNNSNINKKAIVDRMEINKLTQMVTILERDLLNFQISKNFQKANNPLIPLSQLFSGIFLSIISLLWILQIIFAVLTKPIISPFLNIYLIWFDSWFPMFGNLTYALFSLYLLMCTIIGCFKISMKSFCCKLHPMKINGTYINSFLFNLGIILLCTIPLIHFCVVTFNGYTVDTDVYLLFNIQIKYLHFYTVFYGTNNVFIWMLMLSACAILPYYFVRPLEVANDEDTEEMKKKFLKRRDKENNNNNDNNNNSSFLTRFLSFLFYPLNFLRYFSTSSSSGEKSFNFNNPSRNNKYAPTSSVNMDVEDRIIKENKKKIIVRK